jgi:hypothetical protein
MGKDLIVGVVDNYDWDKIKYWANSIDRSGFDGYKALIVYNMDKNTAQKLTEKQFMLIGCSQYDEEKGFVFVGNTNIMVDRFLHIQNFLAMLDKPMDVNRVIITDVRDVVFQKNPTEWLDKNYLKSFDIVVGSENMTYDNEPWGKNNLAKSFGEYFLERKREHPIYCAGVIAGDLDSIKDFCLNLWLICRGLNPWVEGGGGPDQAAMNIMIDLEAYHFSTLFTDPSSGWVLHSGTSMPAIKAGSGGIGEEYIRNPNMEIKFIEDNNYSVVDDSIHINDNMVTILHQWDRVPDWKKMVEAKYGNS